MSFVYRMPSLGSDMEAGTLVEWLKQPGDSVERGDVVAVVETQKGAIDVEIFTDGVLTRHLLEPGMTVPVGTPMAELEGEGPIADTPIETRTGGEPGPGTGSPLHPERATEPASTAAPEQSLGGRLRASPAARRLAAERGIALQDLKGSGPDNAIVMADLVQPASVGTLAPNRVAPDGAKRSLDHAAMRRAIAAAMSRSKRDIPHYYLSQQIDLSHAAAFLTSTNAVREPDRRLLMGALFLKAVALALRAYPGFNGFNNDDRFEPGTAIHVGSATTIRGGGVVAPAIHNTDQLSLDQLMLKLKDLVTRVRSGSLRSSELSDPTITVSSLGERGVDVLYPIIYPPQVAIVGFGKVAERPWVANGTLCVRSMVTATLSADHRYSDGHGGALFLAQIANLLQEPEQL